MQNVYCEGVFNIQRFFATCIYTIFKFHTTLSTYGMKCVYGGEGGELAYMSYYSGRMQAGSQLLFKEKCWSLFFFFLVFFFFFWKSTFKNNFINCVTLFILPIEENKEILETISKKSYKFFLRGSIPYSKGLFTSWISLSEYHKKGVATRKIRFLC